MAQELSFILKLQDEATNKLNEFRNELTGLTDKQLKQAGTAMTGFGVAVLGALTMAGKAAAEEQAGIMKLAQAMKNVGVQYKDVEKSLEKLIATTQKKTATADDEQREVLAQLVTLTGDYQKAVELLPLALDMARGANMSAATAAQTLGRVSQGNTTILSRYGISLKEGATATEALAKLQEMYGGQAVAYGSSTAGAMAQIGLTFGDLTEQIGTTVLPILSQLARIAAEVLGGFQKLPGPVQDVIVIVAALAGTFAAIAGPILLFLGFIPQIIAGLTTLGAAFTFLTAAGGPITLVALAIAGLVTAGVLLVKHWDTVKGAASTAWHAIASAMKIPINAMISYYEFWANAVIKAVNLIISALNTIHVSIPDWVPGIGGKGFGIDLPHVPEVNIPRLASGGIVTRPTMALIGESGPEAVVPLGRGGTGITVNVNTMAWSGDESSVRQLARIVLDSIREDNRLRYYGRAA
jgi:hypothetical protein